MSVFAILLSISAAFAAISPEVERAELMAEFEAHMEGMHDHMPGERGICLTGLMQRLELGWQCGGGGGGRRRAGDWCCAV